MISGTYSAFSPILSIFTIIVCFIFTNKSIKSALSSLDGKCAVAGMLFGVIMTFISYFYTSRDLFLLSPTIAIGCSIYIRYRDYFLSKDLVTLTTGFIKKRYLLCLDILYWIAISMLLIILYTSQLYTRPLPFFIVTAFCVATLGVTILLCLHFSYIYKIYVIIKIFLLSTILRYSAYFLSAYPIGSDPWVHFEYVNFFLENHYLSVPSDFIQYYVYYPISHVLAINTNLLANLSIKESWFIIGIALLIGSIFAYLIVRYVTGNENIALFSILLLNFSDSNIQWSVQIIAMSLGIVLYAFILYLFIKNINNDVSNTRAYGLLLLVIIFSIIFTHTISSFIVLITFTIITISFILYNLIYGNKNYGYLYQISLITLIVFSIMMITKWSDPQYSFIERTGMGLINSLNSEASFLGKVSNSNVTGTWFDLYNPIGFVVYIFFGIIGTLYCISAKKVSRPLFALFCTVSALFFIRYAFPIMGLRNIIPDRWPAFAMFSFITFVSIGFYSIMLLLHKKVYTALFIFIVISIMTFFMITNGISNMDSPIFATTTFEKLIWPDSQMYLFNDVALKYDGVIISDAQTIGRPFTIYYKIDSDRLADFRLHPDGNFDYSYLTNKLIIWRKDTLTLPVAVNNNKYITELLLGQKFHDHLENGYNSIFDSGTSKAYI